MINKLFIQNVALIEKAEINFNEGLNILSGETGAGKSVILDSVNFVLGAKADKSMVRYGESFCFVSAEFDISKNTTVKEALSELEIDCDDDVLIISRKFTLEGKSSIKVNGMSVNVTMLRKITSSLIDVHGQSEHFFLLKESNQLKVIDNICGSDLLKQKEELKNKLTILKEIEQNMSIFGMDEGERNRKLDVLKFQIDEIGEAELKAGEEDELILKRNKINSVEKILTALKEAEEAFSADGCTIDSIRVSKRSIGSISSLDRNYETLEERMETLLSDAEDIANDISSFCDELEFNEEELNDIEDRLSMIRTLKKKYGGSIENALLFLENAIKEYEFLKNGEAELDKLTKKHAKITDEIFDICCKITNFRKTEADRFTDRVVEELKTLNIPSAKFSVEFESYTKEDVIKANSNGLDKIVFMFSANAGEPLKPLSAVISGGEMSRFMLAIKKQLSKINDISTYIFDEIDAGISGQTAKVVAEKFAHIAQNTQIIAVSHLAQIACMADNQFLIKKTENGEKTLTNVYELNDAERIEEIVRLLGGDNESGYAQKHAKEMIQNAKNYKNSLTK